MRSTGEFGTDAQEVVKVAPWSVLTLLERLVRFCRSEKKMSPFLSNANSGSPPPWGPVAVFPTPIGREPIGNLSPGPNADQIKLSVPNEPLGTAEYHRS